MTTWHKGPPPSIGWWPASLTCDAECLRWWNGASWSCPAYPEFSVERAQREAEQQSYRQNEIEWTERPASWPERSRT
jgi:hypothetical protein